MANEIQDPVLPYNADAAGKPVRNLYAFSSPTAIARLRRVEKIVPYERTGSPVLSSAATQSVISSAISNGKLDLASSSVVKTGSVPPSGVSGQFTASADTSSITWYWDGTNSSQLLVINRADGTLYSVPPGSITVTGLTANTTYYFLPFWNISAGCQVSWVIGTHGSPKIAFVAADKNSASAQTYAAQQSLQGREQLTSGWMSYATTASGSSSGGGGGGGAPGQCVMTGTYIDPIGDYGTMTKKITGQFQWTRIGTESFRSLNGTPDHPIYACTEANVAAMQAAMQTLTETSMAPYRIEMQQAVNGLYLATVDGAEIINSVSNFNRTCSKICVELENGHLFWANGVLSHNTKLSPL